MQPYKVFLFTFLLFLVAGVLIYLSPLRELRLSSGFNIRFPQKEDISLTFTPKPAPIPLPTLPIETYSPIVEPNIIIDSNLSSPDFYNLPSQPLEYKDDAEHPLKDFYELLLTQKEAPRSLRILHYGDSQIEGDRITKTIRKFMQACFGGEGVGSIPLFNNVSINEISVKKSNSLLSMEMFKQKRKGNFGLYNAYLYSQDIFSANAPPSTIHIRFNQNQRYKDSTLELTLLAHEDLGEEKIDLEVNKNKNITPPIVKKLWGLTAYTYNIPSSLKDLNFTIQQGKKHYIYGLSLQSKHGIIVDNLPIRGNSGNIFTNNNRQFLNTNYELMDVKFIIYQFGINAIPQDPNTIVEDYSYYEKMISAELTYLHSIFPDLPILVVSTSDRSRKDGLDYETNPNVYKVIEAQRNAAFSANCAFWDLFSAMGGDNSIYRWGNETPPLANKDYIHFSTLGAEQVGKMIYKSIIEDFERYLKKKQTYESRPQI